MKNVLFFVNYIPYTGFSVIYLLQERHYGENIQIAIIVTCNPV